MCSRTHIDTCQSGPIYYPQSQSEWQPGLKPLCMPQILVKTASASSLAKNDLYEMASQPQLLFVQDAADYEPNQKRCPHKITDWMHDFQKVNSTHTVHTPLAPAPRYEDRVCLSLAPHCRPNLIEGYVPHWVQRKLSSSRNPEQITKVGRVIAPILHAVIHIGADHLQAICIPGISSDMNGRQSSLALSWPNLESEISPS